MIKKEFFDGNRLCKTYSDSGKMIKQVYDKMGRPIVQNAIYAEAIDIVINGYPRYDYIETDIDIEKEEEIVEEVGSQEQATRKDND